MNSNSLTKSILKTIAILVGVFLLLVFLYKIQSVLVYIAIASVIALVGRPINLFLKQKLKFPNALAVVSTMALFFLIFMGLISLFIPLVVKQGENLSLLNMEKLQQTVQDLLNQSNAFFLSHGIDVLDHIKQSDLFDRIDVIPNFLNEIVGTIGTFSIGLFSVAFITFFLMKDTHIMENSIYVFTDKKNETKLRKSLGTIKHLLSRYFYRIGVSNYHPVYHLLHYFNDFWNRKQRCHCFFMRPLKPHPLRGAYHWLFSTAFFNNEQQSRIGFSN